MHITGDVRAILTIINIKSRRDAYGTIIVQTKWRIPWRKISTAWGWGSVIFITFGGI